MRPILPVAGLLLLLQGCGGTESKPAPAEAPIAVRTAVVGSAMAPAQVAVVGTVRLRRETALSFTTPGRIAQLLVNEGDTVQSGQLLARLDTRELDAAQRAAASEVDRAAADLRRQQDLFAKGWVTQPVVERAGSTLESARAALEAARFDVRFAEIRAPGPGRVLIRHVEPGQVVQAGAAVVTVGEAASGHIVRAPLADRDMTRIRMGQGAAVRIAALGDSALAGRVTEIGARGDAQTGAFEVEVALPDVPGLRSGMVANADIAVAPAAGHGLSIPANALFSVRAEEGFVFVVPPGSTRAKARLVRLGRVDDRSIEVLAGLQSGERIVTGNVDRLRDGSPVRVIAL